MRPNFRLKALKLEALKLEALKLGAIKPAARDPRALWKWVLGVLAAANVIALLAVVQPFGGSVASLEQQLDTLRKQIQQQQIASAKSRATLDRVVKAREEQERFMREYFMDRRTTSSTILTEIDQAAGKAGLKTKEHTFQIDLVEGSDTISMMTITANYEGTYADLVEYVSLVDRSKRFLIIDNLQAAPQQQQGMLAARFKLNTFVREVEGALPPPVAPEAAPAPAGPAVTPSTTPSGVANNRGRAMP